MGDKYARQCEPCAINAVNESNTQALAELHKLKTALQKIEFSNEETMKKELREKVWKKYDCKCAYCGEELGLLGVLSKLDANVDDKVSWLPIKQPKTLK